jgi:hypothetical protein
MTMASSTTSPTASTMASRVNKLMLKPKTCIKKNPPMSESGMASMGMKADRKEPRKRKMINATMASVSTRV